MQMNFSKTIRLLQEGKQKNFFEQGALYVGNPKEEVFKYFIDSDENTLFDMASMTKIMVTTMVALKCIEEGKLCLWDTLDLFFDVAEDKKMISIQNIMTHTAGFEPFFDIQKEAKTKAGVLQSILSRPLCGAVGGQVVYSCIGYIVLGKILEKVNNSSLDILAKKYVFSPLGLTNTNYNPRGDNIAPTEYNELLKGHLKGIVHDENARFIGASGNAGIFSNLKDTAQFAKMLACKGRYKDKVYLSLAMFERATYNYTQGMNEARGLGFSLYNHNLHSSGDLFTPGSFGHTGFTGTSLFVDTKTGLQVILLTNRVFNTREDTGFFRLRRQLHNSIVSIYERL